MKTRNFFLLLLAAFIWGVAFVAQSEAAEIIGPFTYLASRSVLGCITLLPVIAVIDAKKRAQGDSAAVPADKKTDRAILIKGGIACGIMLFCGSIFQQIGIASTTVGKAGFITAMYIVFVPVIGVFFGKKAGLGLWLSVALAVCGLFMLTVKGGFGFSRGDVIVFIGTLGFTGHILVIDKFSAKTDGVKMSCIQFFVCAVISAIGMFIFEKPAFSDILAAWLPIVYAGVFSSGVAYTLQIVGQKGLSPTLASLTLSMESVFSALAGFVILKERLSLKELIGCALMLAAIILAQLPAKNKEKV